MRPSGTHSGGLGPHMQNNASVQAGLFTHPILISSNNAYARVGLHSDFRVQSVRAEKTEMHPEGYIQGLCKSLCCFRRIDEEGW